METTKGNKLIATFMGVKPMTEFEIEATEYEFPGQQNYIDGLPAYDLNWDQLMPVVDKIESFGKPSILPNHLFRVDIDGHLCVIVDEGEGFIEHHRDSKINSVWYAIVEFIEWYNKNNVK